MRKILLILLLTLSVASGAWAEALPMANVLDMHTRFERYQSFEIDESTGEWSAHTLVADQLLSAAAQGDVRGHMRGGVCILYPGVRGNRDLSLIEPVLYVYLLRNSPIKADALSITTGDVRYDFALAAEEASVGTRKGERFTLPLDEKTLPLLKSFADEGGEVRIYGESKVFRTRIEEADEYRSGKSRVEAMSVAAVRDFLPLWPEEYGLWDLNQAHWAEGRPEMAASALSRDGYSDGLPALEAATQCLDIQDRAAIRAYQQMLKDHAFFTGKVDAAFGKITRAATKQVQQYYGLVPTGMPDRALIERMAGEETAGEPENVAEPSKPLTQGIARAVPGETYALEGQFSIRIDRAWMAHSFTPSQAPDGQNQVWPANRSNRLYICDGEIANLSGGSMNLPLVIRGSLRCGGVSFPCAVQCERDEGSALGTTLLPMERARLIVSCELPGEVDVSVAELELTFQDPMNEIGICFGM